MLITNITWFKKQEDRIKAGFSAREFIEKISRELLMGEEKSSFRNVISLRKSSIRYPPLALAVCLIPSFLWPSLREIIFAKIEKKRVKGWRER